MSPECDISLNMSPPWPLDRRKDLYDSLTSNSLSMAAVLWRLQEKRFEPDFVCQS